MDLQSVIGGSGLVTLILAVGGGVKWWVGRRDKQKDPIPKDAAAVALSASAVELSEAVLRQVRGEMSRLEDRVEAAEGTIRHHEAMFGAAMSYIEALLRHIREGLARPAPPVPGALRDLIDPSLHD